MSYSQLMSQMTLDPVVGTSGTQYGASSHDTPGLSTRVFETQAPSTQDTSALAMKSDQETHIARLSLVLGFGMPKSR
jgi:hypothetical protein